MPQRHPLLDPGRGEGSDMSTHCTASPCPVCVPMSLERGTDRNRRVPIKRHSNHRWGSCLPGRVSARVGGVSAGRASKIGRKDLSGDSGPVFPKQARDRGVSCIFRKPLRVSQAPASRNSLLHPSRPASGVTSSPKPPLTTLPANVNIRELPNVCQPLPCPGRHFLWY